MVSKPLVIGLGLLAGAALAYIASKGVKASAATIGAAAAGAVAGAAGGAVIGIGSAIGIPETDAGQCAKAKAAGETLNASFYCPAGEFWRYMTGNSGGASGSW